MFLRILENKPLIKALFKAKREDLFLLLQDYLDKAFLKRGPLLYELEASKLPKLNEILFALKETFERDLLSAPLPLSFYLYEEAHTISIQELLRPGKIYFYKNLYEEISKAFSSIKLHYRIEKYTENLFELVLPSTVSPKLLFNFKDIFFSPLEKKCFFCHSHWHQTSDCPGLDIEDPFIKFKDLLKISLPEISEKLFSDYLQKKFSDNFFDYFYSRHFYLFPAFLKIPFFLEKEIKNWSQITEDIKIPIKGGDIYLALDDLIHKRWQQAELRIKNIEEDYRVDLLYMMLYLFKEDTKKSIYHIEKALTFVKTPFLMSYLYFFKGYLLHYMGDIFLAEENYKNALKEDSSCIPAFYFLHLLNYNEEASSKIFTYFRHPYLIYLAFLEPSFLKHEEDLEKELEKAMNSYKEEAIERLKEVENKVFPLKELMTEEELREYQTKISDIRKDIYESGIALIDVASKKALELSLELSGYIFTKHKKLKRELEKNKGLYEGLFHFWQAYPYKGEDAYFGQKLKRCHEIILRMAKRLFRKEIAKELNFLNKENRELQEHLEELVKLKKELEKKWQFRKKLSKFLKRLSISQGFLFLIYLFPLFYPQYNFLGNLQNFTSFILLSLLNLFIVLISVTIKKE